MIDLKDFRQNPEKYIKWTKDKNFNIDFEKFQTLDKNLLETKQKIEALNAQRNQLSAKVQLNQKAWENISSLVNEVKTLKSELDVLQTQYDENYPVFDDLLKRIPNPALESVTVWKDDSENSVLEYVWKKPEFDFEPKTHYEILEKKWFLDSERAVKISGSRFVFLKWDAVLLELAIVQFLMNKLISKGFIPVIPPVMVRTQAMLSTWFLPYWEDQIYQLTNEEWEKQWLVWTSEVPMVAQHSEETFWEADLPKRYVGFSTCFRSEAGTYWKDMKWLIRVHQFDKVEMVSFTRPEDSEKEHQLILDIEEEIFQDLGIPYQKLNIVTWDLWVPAAKKYDLEAWMPWLNTYKEVTSCSNCTDYQTRRANIKFKTENEKWFVHSLNWTASAIGRTIVAIVENYQTKDWDVIIPEVLRKYMWDREKL